MSEAQQARPVSACPYCGGEQFTDGEIASEGLIRFAKTFPDGRKPAGQAVHARKCDQCGNIQFYVRQ